jgi:hypothetical protein
MFAFSSAARRTRRWVASFTDTGRRRLKESSRRRDSSVTSSPCGTHSPSGRKAVCPERFGDGALGQAPIGSLACAGEGVIHQATHLSRAQGAMSLSSASGEGGAARTLSMRQAAPPLDVQRSVIVPWNDASERSVDPGASPSTRAVTNPPLAFTKRPVPPVMKHVSVM